MVALVAVTLGVLGLAVPASAESAGIEGVVTDESGHYDLYYLAPGEYRLRVSAGEYVEQWSFGKTSLAEADRVTSPGTASFQLTPLDYGSISGRFVDSAGAPVPNASVELRTVQENWVDQVGTDENGAFRFDRDFPMVVPESHVRGSRRDHRRAGCRHHRHRDRVGRWRPRGHGRRRRDGRAVFTGVTTGPTG